MFLFRGSSLQKTQSVSTGSEHWFAQLSDLMHLVAAIYNA